MENESERVVTLDDFIKSRLHLLEAMGIFAALTLLALGSSYRWIGEVMGALFLFLAFLIWIELWQFFPQKASKSLSIFENILSIGVFIFVLYFIINFATLITLLFPYLIWIITLTLSSYLLRKTKIIDRLKVRKGGRYLVGLLLILLSYLLTGVIVYLFAQPVSTVLMELSREDLSNQSLFEIFNGERG